MPIKVLIVEDDEGWRLLYRLLLRGDADLEIVAEFARAEDALERIPFLYPDVAVVDLTLPGMTGLEFAERLKEEYPAIKVMIVTAHDPEYVANLRPTGFTIVDKIYSEKILEKIKAVCAPRA